VRLHKTIFIIYRVYKKKRNLGISQEIDIVLKTKVKRVGKGIFVSRESSIFVRVKCEMLDSSVVKCDLFYSREA
jgi:hypothetical protein